MVASRALRFGAALTFSVEVVSTGCFASTARNLPG
jgi:hypothetical protein